MGRITQGKHSKSMLNVSVRFVVGGHPKELQLTREDLSKRRSSTLPELVISCVPVFRKHSTASLRTAISEMIFFKVECLTESNTKVHFVTGRYPEKLQLNGTNLWDRGSKWETRPTRNASPRLVGLLIAVLYCNHPHEEPGCSTSQPTKGEHAINQ